MASNVIQQNRQRRYQHRQNSYHLLKQHPNEQCIKEKFQLKIFSSQQQVKSIKKTHHHGEKNSQEANSSKTNSTKSISSTIFGKIKKLNIRKSLKSSPKKILRVLSAGFLFRFFLLLTSGSVVSSEGNIGCNFMRTLCIPGSEVCFDDDIFGKCIPTSGVDAEDIDRTPLSEEQSDKLATTLLELQGAGLGWDHPYVQCRIQGQLFSMQRHTQLPPNLCANLAPIPNENDRNGDMGYVRFIPPLEDYVDANDETEHNLLYFPPMKKQASVDTIFHELQQQEFQRQRQLQQKQLQRQPDPFEFLPYGGFDDRYYQQESKAPMEFNPFLEHERARVEQERQQQLHQSDIENARKRLYQMLNDQGVEKEPPENRFLRQYEQTYTGDDLPSVSGMFLPEDYTQQSRAVNFFNSFVDNDRGRATEEKQNFLQSDLDNARKKLYRILNDYGMDKETPDQRFLKSFEKTIQDPDSANLAALYGPEDMGAFYESNMPENYEAYKRMENKEPPKEEPTHRSFFRELAAEQGIEQAPLIPHQENDDDEFRSSFDPEYPRFESQEDSDLEQLILDNSLVRNSLKPFEEEAILSSNPFSRKQNHHKVEKAFTEGGLVLVPHANIQSDAAYNSYDDGEDSDTEKEKAREFLADMLGFTRHERLDVKKPGPIIGPPNDFHGSKNDSKIVGNKEILPSHIKGKNDAHKKKKFLKDQHSDEDHAPHTVDTEYVYVTVKNTIVNWDDGARIMTELASILHMKGFFNFLTVHANGVSFRVDSNNPEHKTAADIAKYINDNQGVKNNILRRIGFQVQRAGVGDKFDDDISDSGVAAITEYTPADSEMTLLMLVLIVCLFVAITSLVVLVYHRRRVREKLNLLTKGGVITGVESCSKDYQDLCRARMAGKGNTTEPVVSGRIMSLSKENERPPSSRSSTSSWCEEPALTNMDISTGHMVLSYMEDHLRNKGRLQREWEALCRYEAEPSARDAAQQSQCANFNRPGAPLPYDHSRVVLNHLANAEGLDYINASSITDHDPRAPAYVAAQGPLPSTLAHFWQMIWEQGAVVIVSLCRLQENGEIACARYWPEEGAEVYHIYEVHLVSEHIWCDDYLVRSFYLKNLRTSETRTVTQFHFLSWPPNGVPAQAKALLDFRRKVNKSYRGRSCPIVVHGSTGAGRTGAYILLDLVLGRMNKGAREIDIAATLEHLRDQRAGLVATRQQFEFVLMAVAEEVHAILKALPANQSNEKKDNDKETANGTHGNGTNGTSNNGTSVAGGVLKEEESENTEEEVVSSTNTKTSKENLTTKEKSDSSKGTSSKTATPAKTANTNDKTGNTNNSSTSNNKKK